MPVTSTYKWPRQLNVVSWIPVGVDIAHSWGDLLTADTGMKILVGVEHDTVDRFRWLGRLKLFDLGGASQSASRRMLIADQLNCVRDGGPFPVRVVWVLSKGNGGFFTRGDSNIKRPQDIQPGTRLCHMTYAGSQKNVDGLVAWAQRSHDEIVWVDVNNWQENWQAVVEGRADIGFCFPTSPTMIEAEKNPHGISWIDLNAEADTAGARRFRDVDQMVTFSVIRSGVASSVGHWGTTGIDFELTRGGTDPELVYNLVKWLDENYERFKDKHLANRFRNRETLVEGLRHTFLPCHEGLITYLKEIGVWTKAHDLRQKENQELVDSYADGYLECMRQADAKQIWVARENEEWVKFWNNYRKSKLRDFSLFDDLPQTINQ